MNCLTCPAPATPSLPNTETVIAPAALLWTYMPSAGSEGLATPNAVSMASELITTQSMPRRPRAATAMLPAAIQPSSPIARHLQHGPSPIDNPGSPPMELNGHGINNGTQGKLSFFRNGLSGWHELFKLIIIRATTSPQASYALRSPFDTRKRTRGYGKSTSCLIYWSNQAEG